MPPTVPERALYPSAELMLYWLVTGQLWRLGIGEDPNWGKRPVDQIALQATIFEMAGRITDEAVRKQVQTAVGNGMVSHSQAMAKAAGH